ncbi:ABC transporter ATP-binding protein [Haloferacaceae archaeon DSL9]
MTGDHVVAADRNATDDIIAQGNSATIRLSGLRKEYGDVVAVDHLDLTIREGEFLVLLGPSGCGKTTTLRTIAGLETPTDGTIELGDEDVTNVLPQKRDLSMVFQSYALYPHKNVRENLAFPLQKTDFDEETRDRRIRRTAELLEIDDLLDDKPGELSGGQRQRVALGRTIVREPRAFLMDEPLSNLDAKLRVHTRSELRDLQQRLGTTTVYVTHDQEEAMSVADRIAIMNDGVLQQVGTPREVYERPANAFVAGFLGEPPMNFVDPAETAVRTAGADSFAERLPSAASQIGIRPEHVDIAEQGRNNQTVTDGGRRCELTGRALVVEPLGNAYEVEFDIGTGQRLTARLRRRPETVREGEPAPLAFDFDDVYAFDADGEVVHE